MPRIDNVDISLDELIAQFGDYYLDSGQNMTNLHMLPFEPFGTAEAGIMRETTDTIVRNADIRTEEVLQPYQPEFTPKGGMKVLPVQINLHHIKMDLGVIPNQVKGSWLDFLASDKNLDPISFPLIAFIIEKYLIPQVNQDLEMNAIYKGVYKAPDEAVAGNSIDVMDGLEVALNTMEASDSIDFEWITTGAIPTAPKDFVTQVEAFIKAIPEKYRYNFEMCLNMNRTLRDKFKQGMRDKYNMYYDQSNNLLQVMDFPNFTVEGRASMLGRTKIWCTPKENLWVPVKGFGNKNAFELQKFNRQVKFLTDWWIGAGFIQPEMVFATEQV